MLVTDIMTRDVVVAVPDMSVSEVAKLMGTHDISGLPVVDGDRLVGLITELDLIARHAEPDAPSVLPFFGALIRFRSHEYDEEMRRMLATTATELMSTTVYSIREDATVEELADLMYEREVNPVPVLSQQGRLWHREPVRLDPPHGEGRRLDFMQLRSPNATDIPNLLCQFPRSVAIVNLDAIASNVQALVREIGPERRLIAVVKANAYGHGAAPVAITALQAGATTLAVACVDEGIQLRRTAIEAPILLLGATPPEEMCRVVAHDLTPTVCSVDAARALQAASGARRAALQVKVDCGLHRFGVAAEEAVAFVTWVANQPRLALEGLYTHFSSAEEADGEATAREYAQFAAVVAALRDRGIRPSLHAANSAATMGYPALRLDLVRVGLALYGLAEAYPGASRLRQWPALQLHSRVSRVHSIPAGDGVGYGRTFVAEGDRRLALLGIGYADGFPRLLGGRAVVLIGGQRAAVVGRVSMDQIVVDVTDIDDVRVGQPATVIGRQDQSELRASDIADWAETIPYEVVTGLAPRLPRAYLRHGRLVGVTDLLGDHQLTPAPHDAIFTWPSTAAGAECANGS